MTSTENPTWRSEPAWPRAANGSWRLADLLPVIGIPLLPSDGEIPLDLQAVLNRCYETGPYQRRVVYDPDRIVPPLMPQQTEWVKRLLEELA